MQTRLFAAGALVATCCLGGCGTLNNTIVGTGPAPPHEYTPPLEVYGGVREDLRTIVDGVTPPYPDSFGEGLSQALGTAMLIVDVPLSAVGDTLTLPKTLPATMERTRPARPDNN